MGVTQVSQAYKEFLLCFFLGFIFFAIVGFPKGDPTIFVPPLPLARVCNACPIPLQTHLVQGLAWTFSFPPTKNV
jgi:hypothetical protein